MASMSPDEERVLTDEFIDRVTYTKEYSLKGMIRGLTLPPAVPLPPSSSSSKSSLGRLNGLPVELLHMVLVFLDGQSLVRLAETSHRAKEIVDTLPVYQELRQHIPDVLVALAKTHMLRCHGISDIQRALRSSACASCLVSFGGFFFLPTCERVCFDCLYENRALRMITLANARECFRLTARQLETGVPILNTIPGSYSVKWHKHHPNVHRLVNVRQVKAYAIKVHGSIEAVDALLPSTKPGNWSARKYNMFKSFHEASLEPPGRDLTLLPEQIDAVNDDFGGVASIRVAVKG
ncbi:hypothetical protein SBRCBS47491_009406 [Sporothrix bragantina]|uniref:F-box domain-containing protein n=1 Tax=Sporothrix bragantina TaxID=671064 RepID=A0ABP0CUG5_9PEZI